MLTVQEIQSMSFEKAVFGGYDMKTVDEFIEQVTEDYAALQKENAALKSKMKVLVDKIEEYKSVEDGMRRALLSAQNIAQETMDKAKTDAEKLLTAARSEADTQTNLYHKKIEEAKAQLAHARKESSEFISKMTGYFEKQMRELVAMSTSNLLADTSSGTASIEQISQTSIAANAKSFEITRDFGDEITPSAQQESTYTIPEDIRQYMQKQQESNHEGVQIKVTEATLSDAAKDISSPTKPL